MRKSIVIYFIFLLWGVACKQKKRKVFVNKIDLNQRVLDSIYLIEKLDTNKVYKPLSIFFKGKPIFSIGQKLNEIDSTLNYRFDPNMDYQDYFPVIKDYMTTEDRFSVYKIGENSYIGGVLYFSVDQKFQRIFNISGVWGFHSFDNNVIPEMETWITENVIPNLKENFKLINNWNHKIETKNQIEHFELKKENGDWVLYYEVELK